MTRTPSIGLGGPRPGEVGSCPWVRPELERWLLNPPPAERSGWVLGKRVGWPRVGFLWLSTLPCLRGVWDVVLRL